MAALTPEFLFDLESNMRVISAREYERLNANLWWQRVAKRMPSMSKKERLIWFLDTARIQRPQASHGGGQAIFEDLVSITTEYEAENAVAGLQLKKEQLEDLDGNGVKLAADWSRQIGAYAAYWPQREVAAAIRANGIGYDGQNFFDVDHPVNPFNTGAGVYRNLFTGSPSGIYPGALPIGSVTLDVATANLQKAIAYIASIPMPNGLDPRQLRVAGIMHPPALTARVQEMTKAKFIAKAAASGGGSSDVEAIIRNWGFGEPIEAPELASAFGGSDTSWYLVMEEITSSELGAMTYVDREPFAVIYHNEMTSAEIARKRLYQWTTEGRNVVGLGHPYLLFRADAT